MSLLFALGVYGQPQKPVAERSRDAGSAVSTPVVSTPIEPETPAVNSPVTAGSQASSQAIVPRLIKFSGVLRDILGKELNGPLDVTFSLYNTEGGGDPLWYETQTVQADQLGHYTALLGAMHSDGLPVELFTSGEAHWLGIQVGHEQELQPRVLLVSVPYALKAGDAETLAGKPASAYMLSDSQSAATFGARGISGASAVSPAQGGGRGNKRTENIAALSTVAPCTTDSLGAVQCLAQGSNQSVTLTPSGTGQVNFGPSSGFLPAPQSFFGTFNSAQFGCMDNSFTNCVQLVNQNNATSGGMLGLFSTSFSNNASGTIDYNIGSEWDVYSEGAGNVTKLFGINGFAEQDGSGTVTTMASLHALSTVKSAGIVTTNYGLLVEPQTVGSTNYAVYTSGTAPSSFGGKVSADSLDITSTTSGLVSGVCVPSGNGVLDATCFKGSDAAAKIAAALAALPVGGGIVDARGFIGSQTCAGGFTVGASQTVILAPVTFTIPATINVTVGTLGTSGRLIGTGAATIISYKGHGFAVQAVRGNDNGSQTGLYLENLSIEGTASGQGGIRLVAFNGGTLRNVSVNGFKNGDGFRSEGANDIDCYSCIFRKNLYGIHNLVTVFNGAPYSSNAINFYGGASTENLGWGLYEDSGVGNGINIGNQYNGMTFALNGINGSSSTGQIFIQMGQGIKIVGSYFEQDPGLEPLNVIVLGDATHVAISTQIFANSFLSGGATAAINNAFGRSTTVVGNVEEGAPTQFILDNNRLSTDLTQWGNFVQSATVVSGPSTGSVPSQIMNGFLALGNVNGDAQTQVEMFPPTSGNQIFWLCNNNVSLLISYGGLAPTTDYL